MGPESASSSKLQLNVRTTRARPDPPNVLPTFPDKIRKRWRKEEASRRGIREGKLARKAEKDRRHEETSAVPSGGEESTLPAAPSEDEDEDAIRSYYASPSPVDDTSLDPRTRKRRRLWRDPLSALVEGFKPSASRSISPSAVSAALQAKGEWTPERSETIDSQPSTNFLKIIHNFASEYYLSRGWLSPQPIPKKKAQAKQKGRQKLDDDDLRAEVQDGEGDEEAATVGKQSKVKKEPRQGSLDMYRLFDGSALMAIGMLLQEHVIGLVDGETKPPDDWLREMGYIEDEDKRRRSKRRRQKKETTSPMLSSPGKQAVEISESSSNGSERGSASSSESLEDEDNEMEHNVAGEDGNEEHGDDTTSEEEGLEQSDDDGENEEAEERVVTRTEQEQQDAEVEEEDEEEEEEEEEDGVEDDNDDAEAEAEDEGEKGASKKERQGRDDNS